MGGETPGWDTHVPTREPLRREVNQQGGGGLALGNAAGRAWGGGVVQSAPLRASSEVYPTLELSEACFYAYLATAAKST